MKALCAALTAVVLLLGAGCGDDEAATTGTATTTAAPADTTELRVYFLREGKVWPVAREVEESDAVAAAALEELVAGPTTQEADELAATSAIPEDVNVEHLEIDDGVARLELSAELPDEALAQVVYTMTQFSTVDSVEIQDRTSTRGDFEELTPLILVESPLAFEHVESPLRVTGTANAFEATFQYELTDTDGRIVDENFVTATSGNGTRGTFDFTTGDFTVPFDGVGSLIVFEISAKDGSRIHLVEIPLRMTKD